MFVIGILAALLAPPAPTAQTCSGVPKIESVVLKDIQDDGAMKHYTLKGTVGNRGARTQRANVLQSVEVLQDGQKINEIGIPPLRAGRTYQFTQNFVRSAQAGSGTTELVFQLVVHRPRTCGGSGAVDVSV